MKYFWRIINTQIFWINILYLKISFFFAFPLNPPPVVHSTSPICGVSATHSSSFSEINVINENNLACLKETKSASQELLQLVAKLRAEEGKRRRFSTEHNNKHNNNINNNKNNNTLKDINGLLPVFKPAGITSADACRVVHHILDENTIKVGHGGTLDPAASGVLVLGIGRGTAALQQYLDGAKEYLAWVRLGIETDTLDAEGERTREAPWEHLDSDKLEKIILTFNGTYLQHSPLYSAKRVQGKPLYKLAREGISVPPEERPAPSLVTIEDIKLHLSEKIKLPDFILYVRCSKGTYIRQLAADIAAKAGSVAHLVRLLRTRQGPFTLNKCISLERLSLEMIYKYIIPLKTNQSPF